MTSPDRTREPQYQSAVELRSQQGLTQLGLTSSETWNIDPRRLGFVLARYKFVSKMFRGLHNVLEIGCGDAFGTRIVLQEVGRITAIDFDPVFISDAQDRMQPEWKFDCCVHDMLSGPVKGEFDGAYSLDVFEHIPSHEEDRFLQNIVDSLNARGIFILGSPSLESQVHASPASKVGHVNCKSGDELQALVANYFHHVFLFSMNDEVVHTGFSPMAHYLLVLACGRKDRSVTEIKELPV